MKNVNETTETKILQSGIDNLENVNLDSVYGCDLHNKLYNEDYFVIGYHDAEQLLNEYGTFEAIREVKEYEENNFGEVTTDLSDSEKVCNMLAYIKGEEFLSNCQTLSDKWDNYLTEEDLEAIKNELEAQNV